MNYASCWIQASVVVYAFAFDMELKTDVAWLESGVTWKKQKK